MFLKIILVYLHNSKFEWVNKIFLSFELLKFICLRHLLFIIYFFIKNGFIKIKNRFNTDDTGPFSKITIYRRYIHNKLS